VIYLRLFPHSLAAPRISTVDLNSTRHRLALEFFIQALPGSSKTILSTFTQL